MRIDICRSYPFKWYPTAGAGRFDFDRERGIILRWLGWCFYVTVEAKHE